MPRTMPDSPMDEDRLRYPIGRYQSPPANDAQRAPLIGEIAEAPAALAGRSRRPHGRADTPYRPGGWTVRQVVHHLPDSHVNAYVRLKLALTEESPVIKPLRRGALGRAAGVAGRASKRP